MHSSDLCDEVETLLGENGPSTPAFQSLTYAQRVAVLMLSRGCKHTEVATELNRCVRTLQYWMADPNFRQALHEATSALLKEASALLHSKLGKAIDRLERIAQDPHEPAGARVAANKALITLALRMDNTIGRDEQIQLLREEQQRVLAALQTENSAQTGSEMQKHETPSDTLTTPPPPGLPFLHLPTSISPLAYATASADKSPLVASPFRSFPSFKSLPPHHTPQEIP